jgi:hypothetical protein
VPNRGALRIVIQHLHANPRFPWRLVAYGNGRIYRSPEFESMERLLETFRRAVPGFAPGVLSIRNEADETYIAFTADIELDDSQLSILGLIDSPPDASGPSSI